MIRLMGLKRHLLCLGLSLLASLSVGCAWGQRDSGGSGPPGPEPVEEAGTLLVQNHSDKSVFHLRWRESAAPKWSGDRLDDGDVIKPEQDRRFELAPGTYELRLELGDGGNWSPEAPLQVRPGATTVCVLPGAVKAALGTLTVRNDSAWAIAHVRFSSSTEPGWGPDRLPVGAFLTAGKSRSWKVPAGQYQLQVEFQDGQTQESAAYDVTLGQETLFRIGSVRRAEKQ
jgi:hypothetical protein